MRQRADYPVAYDPHRHPLLGWYRDDDAIALDWISYWLAGHGIDAVSISEAAWTDPLFAGRVPNFSRLAFQLWFPDTLTLAMRQEVSACVAAGRTGCRATTRDVFYAQWTSKLEQKYLGGAKVHVVEHNGRRLAAIYLFKQNELRKALGSYAYNCDASDPAPRVDGVCWSMCGGGSCGIDEEVTLLTQISSWLKTKGFGGLAVFGRRGGTEPRPPRWRLEPADVVFMDTRYASSEYMTDLLAGDDYEALRRKYMSSLPSTQYLEGTLTLATAAVTIPPHHNTMAWEGSSPTRFGAWLTEASRKLLFYQGLGLPMPGSRPSVFIYNVSEWLEAGASLQPNMADGFGYLTAVSAAADEAKAYVEAADFTPVATPDLVNDAKPPLGAASAWTTYFQAADGAAGSCTDLYPSPGGTTVHRAEITITSGGTAVHHVQHYQGQASILIGRVYRLAFRASASAPRTMRVSVMDDASPWTPRGLDEVVQLSSTLRPFELFFIATGTNPDARADFFLGGSNASVAIEDVSLREMKCLDCLP